MSKRSNKRAKKLDQEELLGGPLVSLHNDISSMKDEDLFILDNNTNTQLSAKQLRKKELTDLLFKPVVKTAPDLSKKPKTGPSGKSSSNRLRSNRRFKNLLESDQVAMVEQLLELATQGFISGNTVIGYNGDDDQGDINTDETDFYFMRPKLSTEQINWRPYGEDDDEDMEGIISDSSDSENDDDDDDDAKEEQTITSSKKTIVPQPIAPVKTLYREPKKITKNQQQQQEEEEEDEDSESDSDFDPQFMADWIKYTGNITKPIKSLMEQNKARLGVMKANEQRAIDQIDRDTKFVSKVKATPEALAKSFLSGKHVDYIDTTSLTDNQDIWDDDVVQNQAEGKKIKAAKNGGRAAQDNFDMEENVDYLTALVHGTMKNKRHIKTSKHVTTQSMRVAPAGLSINPVKEDMKALVDVYARKLKGEQRQAAKIARRLDSDSIKVKYVPNVSQKLRDRMAKTIYKSIPDGHDVHKQKTRQERNAEKKKAENRYQFMLEKREREFAKQVKGVYAEVQKMKKHEKFLEDKLPQIRAEAAEVKKDQPIKFGRNYFKAMKPDLQTETTLAESGGNLRRSFMSTSLLADSFNALQRTNKLEAVGKSGKRPKKLKIKMKDALAPGVRVDKIDVDAIMKQAKERAIANPKPVAATKNKKRKFQEFQNTHGKGEVHYDYGYDSDDDIWG